jgi:hypothetical protein
MPDAARIMPVDLLPRGNPAPQLVEEVQQKRHVYRTFLPGRSFQHREHGETLAVLRPVPSSMSGVEDFGDASTRASRPKHAMRPAFCANASGGDFDRYLPIELSVGSPPMPPWPSFNLM